MTTSSSINVKAEFGPRDAWERRMGQTPFRKVVEAESRAAGPVCRNCRSGRFHDLPQDPHDLGEVVNARTA
jgi:hypothetical protein